MQAFTNPTSVLCVWGGVCVCVCVVRGLTSLQEIQLKYSNPRWQGNRNLEDFHLVEDLWRVSNFETMMERNNEPHLLQLNIFSRINLRVTNEIDTSEKQRYKTVTDTISLARNKELSAVNWQYSLNYTRIDLSEWHEPTGQRCNSLLLLNMTWRSVDWRKRSQGVRRGW